MFLLHVEYEQIETVSQVGNSLMVARGVQATKFFP